MPAKNKASNHKGFTGIQEKRGKLGANHPKVLKGLKILWLKKRAESKKKNKVRQKLLIKKNKQNKNHEKLILSVVKPLRKRGATIKEITLRLNKKKLKTRLGLNIILRLFTAFCKNTI